jgi:hypothetical protein
MIGNKRYARVCATLGGCWQLVCGLSARQPLKYKQARIAMRRAGQLHACVATHARELIHSYMWKDGA